MKWLALLLLSASSFGASFVRAPNLIVSGSVVAGGTVLTSSNTVVEMNSTTKGFFPPRMTTTQRGAIPVGSNSAGLTIFNTTTGALNFFDGSAWQSASGGGVTTTAAYLHNGTASLSSGSFVDVSLTVVQDSATAYSAPTYTIPTTGYYFFLSQGWFDSSGTLAAGSVGRLQLTLNGSSYESPASCQAPATNVPCQVTLAAGGYFTAGNTIKLQAFVNYANGIFDFSGPYLYVAKTN